MTLQSSGAISISQINSEFGRGNNLNAYRGTTWYTDAGGSGTFSTGAISFSDFYGKRATSPMFSFTISTNQTNANLRTLAINAGWNQSSALTATINSGVYISSNSTGTPALTVNGSFPGGVTLVNNGYIIGMGGAGGYGGWGNGTSGIYRHQGSPGSGGGGALAVSTGITIQNNGTIGGGGGGGGGGGLGFAATGKYSCGAGGGGGGGGRSGAAANSAAGAGGLAAYSFSAQGRAGSVGTSSGAGAGGTAISSGGGGLSAVGGAGGSGGGWGSSGSSGTLGSSAYDPDRQPGAGGGAGYAVSGNGYISWSATGTRYGSIG